MLSKVESLFDTNRKLYLFNSHKINKEERRKMKFDEKEKV